ncbi:MAG: hypothetical protein KIT84_25215 [Labilithrix sp.]|nr:hypothetical protein [Labilithrix sp.]MCW5814352.1 hypothetical protein [Labilithrix sp.]
MKAVVVVVAALAVGSVACTIGQERYEVVKYEVVKAPKTLTCDSPFVKVDPASLPKKCGGGERGDGHCYDKTKVNMPEEEFADDACDAATEICVPDKVLLADGKKATSCTAFNGKDGGCISRLSKQAEQNKAVLGQKNCAEDELCAPCIDPRDGVTETGACSEGGVHEKACTGGKDAPKVEMCCHGMGVCMNLDGVPEEQRDNMNVDSCKKDGQVCAPAAQMTGKTVKCDVFGMPGVCLDVCFATQLRSVQKTTRSSCKPTELCLPCAIGKGQGMPGCD